MFLKKICCKDAAKIASELLDHSIPIYHRVLLWIHLKACQTCLYYHKQITALRRLLCHFPENIDDDPESLSPESRERIKKLLEEKNL